MRAVVLTEDRPVLELVELPDPDPGDGEALIRVTGCGICGSDLHLAAHLSPAGMVLGHEIAGVVEAFGPGEVRGAPADGGTIRVGDTVAVRPFAGCGTCAHCLRGRADHCDGFALLGMARPGGFAELTLARADELYRLPASVTGLEQALVEPLAVAHRAVQRGSVGPGDTAVVLGGGPIGQAVLVWLRALGVEHVTVTDPAPARRALALELGATHVVDPLGDELGLLEVVLAGASVVFECVGRPGMINQAMDIAAVDGRVVVVGVCPSPDESMPYTGLRKELDVRYALYYDPSDFVATIVALDGHRLELGPFLEGAISLEELPDRFAALHAGADGGKVVVTP